MLDSEYYGNGALKTCYIQGSHLMGDVRWNRDQGDVMSTSTINYFQSVVAMMAV